MVEKFAPPLNIDVHAQIGSRYGTGFYPRIINVLKSTTLVHDWIVILGGSVDIAAMCESGETEGKHMCTYSNNL